MSIWSRARFGILFDEKNTRGSSPRISRRPNSGRSRWLPDGRTLVFYADDEKGKAVLYRQPIIRGTNTDAQRTVAAASDEQREIESFAVSPIDGRIVLSAGWTESDVLLAQEIPGIGTSRKENP